MIHESSLARSCADVGAFGAGVSVSGSAAPCVAALPAGRSLTNAQVAANACGEVASACNSGRLDTVNLLKVQQLTSCNLQGVVAPNSRRKVRQSCTVGNRCAEQTVEMSPAPAAGTFRRSAGTVHVQRQVSRKRLARSSGVVLVQVLVPVPVVGLVWLGVSRASLRPAWRFFARWWCHLGVINLHRNLWVGRGYVVPRIREFGC